MKRMKDNIYIKSRKKGFILVLTLLVTLILATLVIGFLSMESIDLDLVKNHMYSLKAYYIAEAGVADAIDKIQRGVPITSGAIPFPLGSSDTYTVSVDPNSTITSTGLAATSNFRRTLEVKIKISGSSPSYTVSINQWKEVIQ
jgi:hypothetical protein